MPSMKPKSTGGPPAEDGAVAIIVAISLLLLMGAVAIAVDLGSAWETKREMVIDTDAAALAGAQKLAAGGTCAEAEDAARAYLSANTQGVSVSDLSVVPCEGGHETVEVVYTGSAQQATSGALGATELNVRGGSTAIADYTLPLGRLRPIALCEASVPTDIAAGTATLPSSLVVSTEKSWKSPGCGGASGQWNWLCFDNIDCSGNSDNAGGVRTYLRGGWDRNLDLGDETLGDEDCDLRTPDTLEDCAPKTGGGGKSHADILQDLLCPTGELCQGFPILIADRICEGQDPSDKCHEPINKKRVSPAAFLSVKLTGFCYSQPSQGITAVGDLSTTECETASAGDSNPLVFKFEVVGYSREGTSPEEASVGGESAVLCATEDYSACPS